MKVVVSKDQFSDDIEIVVKDDDGAIAGNLSLDPETAEKLGWVLANLSDLLIFTFEMDT